MSMSRVEFVNSSLNVVECPPCILELLVSSEVSTSRRRAAEAVVVAPSVVDRVVFLGLLSSCDESCGQAGLVPMKGSEGVVEIEVSTFVW